MTLAAALLLLTLTAGAFSRLFTVSNNCPFTIWPAMYTDMGVSITRPEQPTGWEAPPYTSVSFGVPDDWKAGRIWGRRNCDFSVDPGPNSCATGGCIGGFLCDPVIGTGVPPTSVAEWTLQGDGWRDFYDVSLVDGSDLPMRIENNRGCPIAECAVDLGPSCPSELMGPRDSTGFPLGCRSACQADLDGDLDNSPNCCSGSFATPETCPPSGVAFYSYFKGNCPHAYAYAYDESSGTALWTCDSGLAADYTLIFCPPALGDGPTNPGSGGGNATIANPEAGAPTGGTPGSLPTVISGARTGASSTGWSFAWLVLSVFIAALGRT